MNPLLLVSVLLLAPLPADGLRRERLPADVDFVLHLDFEGLKATELWRRFNESPEGAELRAGLDELKEFEARFGIDPLADVRALTLFKVRDEEEPTVVLFSTTARVDEALKRFQREPGYRLLTESGIELHSWVKDEEAGGEDGWDHDSAFAYVHRGAGDERVVVLAGNKAGALRAARVLRGQDPSHASAGSPLTLAPASGSFLYVAAIGLEAFTPASQVFGLAQGIQVDLGEAGGFLRAHMGLTTRSAQEAFDVSNLINGAVSLARLTGGGLGEVLELLTGVRLSTLGSEVRFDFEFEVSRLLEILEGLEDSVETAVEERVHVFQERKGGAPR
jgi:hypothetical protein